MTDRERAIVMAYTGIAMLTGEKFSIFHEYVEEIMGRPVWTHEMGIDLVAEEIKEKAKPDFLELCEGKPHRFKISTASGRNPQKVMQREVKTAFYKHETRIGYKVEKVYFIEVESLEDLLDLRDEVGEEFILGRTYHEENPFEYELMIYDGYIE